MTRSRIRKINRARAGRKAGVMLTVVPLASAVTAILSGSMAFADEPMLEEVIVTAQKRSEDLQKVPLSITALGTAKLEELNVQNVNDYVKFLPSVAYQTVGPGFAKIYMRGVSSGGDGNHSGSLPSVGVYLDEQPITTIQGPLDIHIYDIARVEALAGPQGTLYGASSEAGTLRIITNKPDPSGFKAGYDLQGNTVKHGSQGYIAEGFVNVPIAAKAAIRLVGWYEHDAGYIDNAPGTTTYPISGYVNDNRVPPTASAKKRYNDVDTYGARAALRVELNDNWTITPTVQGQETKANGIFAFDPKVGELAVKHFYPEDARDHWGQASLSIEGKISNFDLVYAGGFVRRNDITRSDYTDYSLAYEIMYSQPRGYFSDNAGNPVNPTQQIKGKDGYKMYSHELRLTTPKEYAFRATLGAFMSHQQHDIEQRYVIDGLSTAASVTGWANTWWLTKELRTNRDYAGFTELSYDIVPSFTVTGGIRYYKFNNSLQGFYGFKSKEALCANFPNGGLPGLNGGPCENINATTKDTGTTPKISLTYRFDDDRLIYATWSKGFRPGGVNRVAGNGNYSADFLTNKEIGWKTNWFGNRLRFNGAIFQEDWKDFQFSFLGANSVTIIKNVGSARIRGIESSIDWAATSALTLSGGFSYLDAKLTANYCQYPGLTGQSQTAVCVDYTKYDPTTGLGAVSKPFGAPSGQQLPTTPKFKGNLTARYEFPVSDFNFHVQGSMVYQSSVWPDLRTVARQDLGQQAAYALFDFSVGGERKGYTAELFVDNAFDRRAEIYRYAECTEAACAPIAVYHGVYAPRTIGVKFGQRF